MTPEDLTNRFQYHKPDAVKVEKHETVRGLMYQVADYLNQNLPESKEKSTAITKLEEAMFWSNAAIARN